MFFPHPERKSTEPYLAVGYDLSVERLKLAYRFGIFPWYMDGQPIIWWSLDPRFVLFPEELTIPKSMRSYLNQAKFKISIDQCFETVIAKCQGRAGTRETETWITEDMKKAYIDMHKAGYAHSIEVWQADELVGGLYGVTVGHIFSGESMFSATSNASKFALIILARAFQSLGWPVIDCQQESQHIAKLGGRLIPLKDYMQLLRTNLFNEDEGHDFAQKLYAVIEPRFHRVENL